MRSRGLRAGIASVEYPGTSHALPPAPAASSPCSTQRRCGLPARSVRAPASKVGPPSRTSSSPGRWLHRRQPRSARDRFRSRRASHRRPQLGDSRRISLALDIDLVESSIPDDAAMAMAAQGVDSIVHLGAREASREVWPTRHAPMRSTPQGPSRFSKPPAHGVGHMSCAPRRAFGLRYEPGVAEARTRVGPPDEPLCREQALPPSSTPRLPAVIRPGHDRLPVLQRLPVRCSVPATSMPPSSRSSSMLCCAGRHCRQR